MIRTAVATRPARAGLTIAAVAGIALLAGCAPAADDTSTDTSTDASTDTGDSGSSDSGAGVYADGTYTAEGSYATPESVEAITVTVTLESDVITSVDVEGSPSRPESEQYQSQFIGGISDAVVGQDIDEISVSRVAGSSLTSGGFNEAIEAIKAEAAA
jgi:uncharacterized protein with FMN-binding domain